MGKFISYGQWGAKCLTFCAFLSFGIWSYGCRVEQAQTLDGEARAKIVVSYPAAEACFVDNRITTFEQLRICLELTTAQRWTVDAEGQIIEALGGGAVSVPTNIEGGN